jgi:hypothetical protein
MKAFNPERIAYYEANGWRAYYDRKWLRLLRWYNREIPIEFFLARQSVGMPACSGNS